MSRAGEKLYGDWPKRVSEGARPICWRDVLVNACTIALLVFCVVAWLFGFG